MGGQATPKHARILGEGVASNKGWKEYFMGKTFKTAFLLTGLTLLLMMIGRAFGGQNGMMIALAVALVMDFVSYFFSDKNALGMYRAKPVTREEVPRAYQVVE